VTLDQDTLMVPAGADGVQLKVTLHAGFGNPRLERLGVTTFRSTEWPTWGPAARVPVPAGGHGIPVAYRSQHHAPASIARRICGPTSLSMALEYCGVNRPTEEVARLAQDPAGPIEFGNWAYLAAAAAELGVGAEVASLNSFDEVVRELEARHPVILALAYGAGELSGAPMPKTAGHLILARGLDASGRVLVNDPAGTGPADGQISYDPGQLLHAWKRGIAIILHPVARKARAH
jgi:hypothetical protein